MKVQNDQFYTNPKVSDDLVTELIQLFPNLKKKRIIEPSAGSGNFINSFINCGISRKKITAYDIDPKDNLSLGIIKGDYLKIKIPFSKKNIVIGNPPFGKRGKLALEFLNKGLNEAPYVCFILPNIFNRYSIQKQVMKGAKLLLSFPLLRQSFVVNDSPYDVKCTFQIWARPDEITPMNNLRILEQPDFRHADFDSWIYNNTKQTKKYFDKKKYKWDIAVVRQGYYDYSEIITDPKKLNPKRQYIFIKFINPKAKKVFEKIDFSKLSLTNTQVLGFSTTDLVQEYKKVKKEIYHE